MIAKASTISHGANAIRYSVNKERADLVKVNLLPNDISPEAVYGRMMLVQKKFTDRINKGRPLDRNESRFPHPRKKAVVGRWMTGHVWQTSSYEYSIL